MREREYTKKDHGTIQSAIFSKNYHMIITGNDVKQMESLRDTTD